MSPRPAEQSIEAFTVPPPKKSAASLLPAFEPLSSSPALPRPLKRTRDALEEDSTYPTPVPTSSTAILSSSPPRASNSRPPIQHFHSTFSERAPLSTVPTIQLNAEGKPTLMGRSSASCHYQLSANRLISRVHVEARFVIAKTPHERDHVEIVCTGWNGIKVHCLGKVYELVKGKKFSSDVRHADIMIDVQDARVLVRWPHKPQLGPASSDEESSPTKRPRTRERQATPPSPSPMQSRRRLASPVSPSPAVRAALLPSSSLHLPNLSSGEPVIVYEDAPSPKDAVKPDTVAVSQTTQVLSQLDQNSATISRVTASTLTQDFSDNDEENDPVIHSFGPFGVNLLPRMASFNAGSSPRKSPHSSHMEPLQPAVSPPQPSSFSNSNGATSVDIKDHIINQLAFSRLSSTPISTILSHLPEEAGSSLTKDDLAALIYEIGCVGEVSREGKDAAGKPLESEYYYIPDEDQDEKRKEAVVNDLMKPGLRSCRKQHKQYFWRKPKKS